MSETEEASSDLWNDGLSDSDLLKLDLDVDACGESSCKKAKLGLQERDQKKIKTLKKFKNRSNYPPLKKYRGRYLWVTDFVKQLWCEQQLIYTYEVPVVIVENPIIKVGETIHLARELEVHDIIQVKVTSPEDNFAVRVGNLLNGMKRLVRGLPCIREIPIFGMPFECDIFIIGKIDEIRCDVNFQLDLVELKTRSSQYLPGPAITKSHRFQVMLYKKLFDDIVLQKLTKETIASKLNLDLENQLGDDVIKKLKCGNCNNLNQLLDKLFSTSQTLTVINHIFIDYVYQGDDKTMSLKNIDYDSEWFENKYQHLSNFWKGKRDHEGVEIEEAWKCNSCTYKDSCEWREKKSIECTKKNKESSPLKKLPV